MGTYPKLSQERRYQISAVLNTGYNKNEIATVIGSHVSTIGRELKHNRGLWSYKPKQVHQMSMQRRNNARVRIQEDTWTLIESKRIPTIHSVQWQDLCPK